MKRPFQVTFLGWLMIVVGAASTAHHLWVGVMDRWMIAIVFVGVVAVVAGVFLLRGARWARWLVLVWVAFHVVVGALTSWSFALPHVVLLVVIGYVVLGPPTAGDYRRV